MLIARVQIADVLAVLGIVGGIIAVIRFWLEVTAERRRRQPVVIAHEDDTPAFSEQAQAWVAFAHLKNESDVPAFNLRFGVEYGGTRFPFRHSSDDPDEGNYQAVVTAGERLPPTGSRRTPVASDDIWATAATKGDLDENRVYWCRYENARGETWETRNPGNRSAKLDIYRVRRLRRRERREQADRDRVRGSGWEAQVLPGRPSDQ